MKDKNSCDYLNCCIMNNCGEPGCDNYSARRDLIQKIIDGQATVEEQKLYDEIIARCNNCECKKYCEQELAIKNILQTKLDRKRVPLDIVEKIKFKIGKNS